MEHLYHLLHEHLHFQKIFLVDAIRHINKEVNICLLNVHTA